MWVKLKTLMAGPEGVKHPGAVIDLPDQQAQQLVDSGQAEAVKAATPALTPNPSPRGRGEKGKEKATSKQAQERETRGAEANG